MGVEPVGVPVVATAGQRAINNWKPRSPGNAFMFPDLSFTHDAPNICWNQVHEETQDDNLCTCERISRKNGSFLSCKHLFSNRKEEIRITAFRISGVALLSGRNAPRSCSFWILAHLACRDANKDGMKGFCHWQLIN